MGDQRSMGGIIGSRSKAKGLFAIPPALPALFSMRWIVRFEAGYVSVEPERIEEEKTF